MINAQQCQATSNSGTIFIPQLNVANTTLQSESGAIVTRTIHGDNFTARSKEEIKLREFLLLLILALTLKKLLLIKQKVMHLNVTLVVVVLLSLIFVSGDISMSSVSGEMLNSINADNLDIKNTRGVATNNVEANTNITSEAGNIVISSCAAEDLTCKNERGNITIKEHLCLEVLV